MFGKKLIKDPIELTLGASQFCILWEGRSSDYSHEFRVDTDEKQYNLYYREGRFLGTPTPDGGAIYPFSVNPLERGSRADKKKISRAKVVCISKTFNLTVNWGTQKPFLMYDSATNVPYTIGANGCFYVEIDPADGGRNADRFYGKLLSQGDPTQMDADALRDKLIAAFINRIGVEIQNCLEEIKRPFASLIGLQPGEILRISEAIYPRLKNLFDDYGLTAWEIDDHQEVLETHAL